jgi:hypothetical protein
MKREMSAKVLERKREKLMMAHGKAACCKPKESTLRKNKRALQHFRRILRKGTEEYLQVVAEQQKALNDYLG